VTFEDQKKYAVATAIGISPFFLNGLVNARLNAWPLAYWICEVLIWVIVPIAVLSYLVQRAGLRFADIGLSRSIFGKQSVTLVVITSLLFCVLCYAVYTGVYAFMRGVLPDAGIFSYRSVLPSEDSGRAFAVFYLAFSAGVVEEIYFRGLLFKVLGFARRAVPLYLLVSPILFAAIHWESGWANTGAAYVYGLFAAVAYLAMRNIWPLIVGHFYTDYIVSITQAAP
jgi:membrane protease YdiL (CAAX protease family)